MTGFFHMLHRALLALPLLLAGCGAALPPDAQCFAEATIEYRAAWRGAEQIRADLARGYALYKQPVVEPVSVPCRVAGARDSCFGTRKVWRATPVAIDRAWQLERLAELEARMEALRPAAMAAAAPCGYGTWSQTDPATLPPAPAPP